MTSGSARRSGLGEPGSSSSVIQRLRCILELRPSLLRILVMWVSTVRSDKNSLPAICLLLRSSATNRAISSCLPVSTAFGFGLTRGVGLGAACPRLRTRPPRRLSSPGPGRTQCRTPSGRSPGRRSTLFAHAGFGTVPPGARKFHHVPARPSPGGGRPAGTGRVRLPSRPGFRVERSDRTGRQERAYTPLLRGPALRRAPGHLVANLPGPGSPAGSSST